MTKSDADKAFQQALARSARRLTEDQDNYVYKMYKAVQMSRTGYYIGTPRRYGKSVYQMTKHSAGAGVGRPTRDDFEKFWHKARYVCVVLHRDGTCTCVGENTPLGPLGMQPNMKQSQLPKWVTDKILKLQMMEAGHDPIAGIGLRRQDHVFWVLAPYKYLPRERWRR